MDIKKVFSVFDCKANAYLPPFVCVSRGVAIRMVRAAALDVKHDFYRFGADYTLFEIGEWNEHKGEMKQFAAPTNMGTALSFQQLECPEDSA